MRGYIKILVEGRNFGFIRDDKHNEFFFHRDDFVGDWFELIELERVMKGNSVEVEFESKDSPKGLRAKAVKLLYEAV